MAKRTLWYNKVTGNYEDPPLAAAVAALEEEVLPPSIPIPKKQEATSEAVYYMLRQPPKPRLYYREDSGVPPGYRLCDIKDRFHPIDYKQFIKEVEPIGKLDGEPIVWALDYVKWVLREEER